MDYEHLRPLGIGEVLDAAFRLYRRRFGSLVSAIAVVVIPTAVVRLFVTISTPTTTTNIQQFGNTTFRTTTTSGGARLAIFLIGLLVSALTIALAQGAAMRILTDHYLGTTTTWIESLQYAGRRLGSLLWVVVLGGLFWILGSMACVIPGIYLYVAFAVAIPVRLVEDVRGTKALSRSRDLIGTRWWATFWTLLVILLISTTLTGIGGLLVGGSSFLIANTTSSTATQITQAILTGAIEILITPISAAVAVIIYFDLRVRKEGFDVALLIQRLGAPVTPASTDPETLLPGSITIPPVSPNISSPASPWAGVDDLPPPPPPGAPPVAPPA